MVITELEPQSFPLNTCYCCTILHYTLNFIIIGGTFKLTQKSIYCIIIGICITWKVLLLIFQSTCRLLLFGWSIDWIGCNKIKMEQIIKPIVDRVVITRISKSLNFTASSLKYYHQILFIENIYLIPKMYQICHNMNNITVPQIFKKINNSEYYELHYYINRISISYGFSFCHILKTICWKIMQIIF